MPILNAGKDSIKHDLQELFETMQGERANLLDALREIQIGARVLTQLEAERLERKHGAGDPRVAALRDRAELTLERVGALEVEAEIAKVRVPPVSKTATLVHGRITDAQLRAAGRMTIRLVTDRGEEIEGVPPVETDDAGYYAFVLSPEHANAIGPEKKVTVVVTTGEEKVVPVSAQPFTVKAGTVSLRELVLTDAELNKLRLRPVFTPVVERPERPETVAGPPGESAGTPAEKPKPPAAGPEKPPDSPAPGRGGKKRDKNP